MKNVRDIRSEIEFLIDSLRPCDPLEKEHIDDALHWIRSGCEIFRQEKPAVPDKHLVSYFVVVSEDLSRILLVDHKKAGLWLPPGGHVEPGEHPKETVKREAREELGMEAAFLLEEPLFITITQTAGSEETHTDIPLWYLLKGDPDKRLDYDAGEFNQIRWFGIDEIPFSCTDPHMERFIRKLINHAQLKDPTWISYQTSAWEYAKNVDGFHPSQDAERFLAMLPCGGKIIDIGCGPGRDAKVFSDKGFRVTGIDYCPSMIDIAKKRAPSAHFNLIDMQSLDLDETFDGAWANASLLHLPKSSLPKVLANIHKLLNDRGILYIKLKEGHSQGVEIDRRYGNLQKFYAYFDKQELRGYLVSAGFEVLDLFTSVEESSYHTHPYIHAFCMKGQ